MTKDITTAKSKRSHICLSNIRKVVFNGEINISAGLLMIGRRLFSVTNLVFAKELEMILEFLCGRELMKSSKKIASKLKLNISVHL